jgi:hypothetical protein
VLLIRVAAGLVAFMLVACSSSTEPATDPRGPASEPTRDAPSTPASKATDASIEAAAEADPRDGGAPNEGGSCAKLAACCPKLPEESWRVACERDVARGDEASCDFDNWYYTRICS